MRMKKNIALITIVLFMAMLLVPFVLSDFKGGKVSTVENRTLSTYPDMDRQTYEEWAELPSQFEDWIDDNIGGRSEMLTAKTTLYYHVFQESTKTNVRLGKNQWIYYAPPFLLDDFTGLNLYSDQALESEADNFLAIDEFLKARGIPMQTFLFPDKKTVYSENYPNGIIPAAYTRSDQLTEYLNEHTDLDFFYLKEYFLEKKENGFVYSPRVDDSHWNRYGAYLGYLYMAEQIKEYLPTIKILRNAHLQPYTARGLFYGVVPIQEEDMHILTGKEDSYVEDSSYIQTYPFSKYKFVNGQASHFINEGESHKILILRDSYANSFYRFFAESFGEVILCNYRDFEFMLQYIDIVDPDIVLFTYPERMYTHFDSAMESINQAIKQHQYTYKYQNDGDRLRQVKESITEEKTTNSLFFQLDTFNGNPAAGTHLQLPPDDHPLILEGWAVDPSAKEPAHTLIAEVNGRLIEAYYGAERKDVAEYLGSDAYLQCRYRITIPASLLQEAGEIHIHVIGQDAAYAYETLTYTYERNNLAAM